MVHFSNFRKTVTNSFYEAYFQTQECADVIRDWELRYMSYLDNTTLDKLNSIVEGLQDISQKFHNCYVLWANRGDQL